MHPIGANLDQYSPAQLRAWVNKLFESIGTLQYLTSITDFDRLIDVIIRATKKTMEVEAASLMLFDEVNNELYFHKVRGGSDRVRSMRLKADQGIAGKVLGTGVSMIVNDAHRHSDFCPEIDRQTGFDTRQILCVPLLVRGHRIGVLQAINKVNEEPFSEEDLALFNAFGHQVATVIEQARLHNLATYDSLTQVFNRRYFDAWLELEVTRVHRNQRSLSLLLMDLDHFKRINDTYGHPMGDAVLSTVGQLLKRHLGDNDIPARYGGEELVVGAPDTLAEAARDKAELIRNAVELHGFEYNGVPVSVTISIGVATLVSGDEAGAGQLLRNADLALYNAKKSRNRVCSFADLEAK